MGTRSRPPPRGRGSCEHSLWLRAKYREAARRPIARWRDLISLGRVSLCVSFKPILVRNKHLSSGRTCVSTTWPGRRWDHKPGLPGHLGDPPPGRNICQPGSGRLWALKRLRLDFPPCCLSPIQARPVSETRGSAGLPAVSPPVAPSEDSGAMVPWSPRAQSRDMFLAPMGFVSASGAQGRDFWGLRPGPPPFLLFPEPAHLQPWNLLYQLTDGPPISGYRFFPQKCALFPWLTFAASTAKPSEGLESRACLPGHCERRRERPGVTHGPGQAPGLCFVSRYNVNKSICCSKKNLFILPNTFCFLGTHLFLCQKQTPYLSSSSDVLTMSN
nr:uncharacterized protein LOC115839855 [Globicephala melas]